jgi:hypothetical protein
VWNEESTAEERLYKSRNMIICKQTIRHGVLTYTTALRRFFGDGGVLRRWCNPMMMTGFAMGMFLLWG